VVQLHCNFSSEEGREVVERSGRGAEYLVLHCNLSAEKGREVVANRG
jgi:hypothetical protein